MIAFVGSVFSPYYAHAHKHGRGDPENFCAINVALYGRAGKRWTLTERSRASILREADVFEVGRSSIAWRNDALVIGIDEVAVPIPRRVRGEIVVRPQALTPFVTALDSHGLHRWGPIAPAARVEVNLRSPHLIWRGHAYVDSNEGDEPIAAPFVDWDWSRATLADGSTGVLYDVRERDGGNPLIAVRCTPAGAIERFEPPPRHPLPGTLWRVRRHARGEASDPPRVLATLEDTPFYVRSMVEARLLGERVVAIHESLSLDRFRKRWVRALLPFRMPRTR